MPVWSNLAFNYGQNVLSGTSFYVNATVDSDLTFLWNQGVRNIRVAMSNFTFADGVNATKLIALAAKAKGFYVLWGVSATGRNDGNWAAFATAINTAADWATSNSIDEFMIGNEQEGAWNISGTLTTPITKILAVAADVKANHFTGTLTYSVAQNSLEATWVSTGAATVLTDLTYLGYNNYGSSGSFAAFKSQWATMFAGFGKNLYLSEFNLNSSFSSFPTNETQQAIQLYVRYQWIKAQGIPRVFFYNFRGNLNDGSGKNDFAIRKQDGTFRKWYSVFFGRAQVEITGERRPTNQDFGFTHDSTSSGRRMRRAATTNSVLQSKAYTVSVWVYPTADSAAGRIFEESCSTTSANFSIQQNNGNLVLLIKNNANTALINNLNSLDVGYRLNAWNHIVFVDNNGACDLYINNYRSNRSFNYTRSGIFTFDRAAIGIESIPANNFNNFQGRIDELLVISAALTQDQVTQLYTEGVDTLGLTEKMYIQFNEGAGTTAADSSGNGNTFTLTSASGAWVARPAAYTTRSLAPARSLAGNRASV